MKAKNLYENDVTRLAERIDLVVGSLHLANGVDQEKLTKAAEHFQIALSALVEATDL